MRVTNGPGLVPGIPPHGIDIYYQDVGGKSFDAMLPHLKKNSRVTRCGLISQYDTMDGRDPAEVWMETG
jgi:NADPH-dependent curcumin reductase CurA